MRLRFRTPPSSASAPTLRPAVRTWWPLALLAAALVAVVGLRASDARAPAASEPGDPVRAATTLVTRTGAGARIEVAAGWKRLGRDAGTMTWGAANRAHTVTVASVEASILPLSGVVDAVVGAASTDLPGATVVGRPRPLDLPASHSREDSALLVRLSVPGSEGRAIEVVQVWRRDTRAQRDLVATWTSSDGRWPVSPGRSIPSADPTR